MVVSCKAYFFRRAPGDTQKLPWEARTDSSEWISTALYFTACKMLPSIFTSVFSNPQLMSIICRMVCSSRRIPCRPVLSPELLSQAAGNDRSIVMLNLKLFYDKKTNDRILYVYIHLKYSWGSMAVYWWKCVPRSTAVHFTLQTWKWTVNVWCQPTRICSFCMTWQIVVVLTILDLVQNIACDIKYHISWFCAWPT